MSSTRLRNVGLAAFIIAIVCGSIPAFSHHGTSASYDMNKTVTLTGSVTEFVYSNPHAQLYMDAKDASGNRPLGLRIEQPR